MVFKKPMVSKEAVMPSTLHINPCPLTINISDISGFGTSGKATESKPETPARYAHIKSKGPEKGKAQKLIVLWKESNMKPL